MMQLDKLTLAAPSKTHEKFLLSIVSYSVFLF